MWTQWTSETAPIFIILSGKAKNYILYLYKTMYTSGKKRTSFFGENKVQRKRWKPENRILKSGIQPLTESGIHRHGIRNPQRGIRNPRLSWITLHGAIVCQIKCPFPVLTHFLQMCWGEYISASVTRRNFMLIMQSWGSKGYRLGTYISMFIFFRPITSMKSIKNRFWLSSWTFTKSPPEAVHTCCAPFQVPLLFSL